MRDHSSVVVASSHPLLLFVLLLLLFRAVSLWQIKCHLLLLYHCCALSFSFSTVIDDCCRGFNTKNSNNVFKVSVNFFSDALPAVLSISASLSHCSWVRFVLRISPRSGCSARQTSHFVAHLHGLFLLR